MKPTFKTFLVLSLFGLAIPSAVQAQNADTIVVFDGSGSMWGQIAGRTKIEIARETLSSVMTEISSSTQIGMIAYGHRQKGVCSDIETVVPVGPAGQAVPRMIDVANRLQPKGKTPLSDAVRIAADELRYTENAATVILVTDGIETCDADPCALATELESAGIGFTAHVIGFGLSADEGRQVQCLADNTGGLYLSANNADELGDALRRTVQATPIAPSEDDFGPAVATTRDVRFIFRDTDGGEQIGIRQLSGILEREDGSAVENGSFKLAYPEAHGNSATAKLEPGRYVALLRREGQGGSGYSVRYAFEVPEGDGEHLIEANLSGSLTLNLFINPDLPYVKGDPFPTAVGGSRPRFNFALYPVENGIKADEASATITGADNLTRPLPPGTYLIEANIDSGTTVERLVEVQAGNATVVDFSFDATRVFIDAHDSDGFPVKRQTTYWYDKVPSGRNYWLSGGGAGDGGLKPFYLPTGQWVVNVGGEGYGDRRSEVLVTVPGTYQDITLKVGESETLSDEEKAWLDARGDGCLEIRKVVRDGCLVERADLSAHSNGSAENNETESLLEEPSAISFTFNARSTKEKAVTFSSGAEGARMTLEDGWCGFDDCAGEMVAVSADLVEAIEKGREDTFDIDGTDLRVFTAPGTYEDMLTVVRNPHGDRPVKGVMVIAPAGQSAEVKPQNTSVVNADTELLFGDQATGKVYVRIDFPEGVKAGQARILMGAGWCGDELRCAGSIAGISADIVGAFQSGRTETFTDSWNVGTATTNPDGQRQTIEVGERGVTRRFQLLGNGS